ERMEMEHPLAQLDGVCEHAAKGDLDYKSFLPQALEAEWRGRHQREVESRLKLARLPWVKSLEQFDFDFQPSIDRKQVRGLAGLGFVERAENVVRLGPPDVGRMHLAIALGVKAVEPGHPLLFLTLESLMGRLVRAPHENRLDRTLQELAYPRVLILDELDRLPHHDTTVNIKGDSYRLRERRRPACALTVSAHLLPRTRGPTQRRRR